MAGFSVTRRGPGYQHGEKNTPGQLPASAVTAQSSLGLNPVPGVLPVANILDPQWGGKADAILVTDAAITTGTNALSSTQAAFTTAANKDQFVIVQGAGPNISAVPGPFSGYISSVSGGVASLVTTKGGSTPANASNTVSGVQAAFGTPLSGPLTTALASGQRVHLPAGNYIWDTEVDTPAALHLSGEKDRTIIYFCGLINLLHVTGPGLQGSSATLSANANWNDQSLSASSIPTGLKAGDFIFLSSTDVFDATEAATTCGEIIRVQGISGTTIALFNPVAGPNNYLTASGAKIQKIAFLEGVTIDDIEFVNAAPELVQEGFAAPATQTATAGNPTGVIWLQYCRGAELSRVRAVGWAASFLLNGPASIETHTTDCHFRGGAQAPVAGSYGYAVSHYGSQWSPVDDCTVDRSHGFVNHAGSGGLALNLPARFNITSDCIAYNGTNDTFLVHNAAAFCDFVNCTSIGGPLFPAENTHEMGFQIVGHYCKLINPSVLNGTGRAINCGGNHCEVINPVIRNMRPWNDRCRGITLSDGTSTPPGFTGGAGGHKVINADIDGIPFASGNVDGVGILVAASTPNCEISGRIRNTAWNGVQITDASDTTVIDGLTGINNGNAGAGPAYLIQTATTNPAARWQNVRAINPFTAVTNQPSGLVPVTYGDTLPGIIGPSPVYGNAGFIPTASRAYFVRIVPQRRMVIIKIALVTSVAATNNDAIDVGIYDSTLTKIVTTGSTSAVANATAGVQAVSITSTVLSANTVYYLALAYGTVGGTAATIVGDSLASGNLANLFATTAPNVLHGFANTSFPLPGSITPGGVIAAVPILAARES